MQELVSGADRVRACQHCDFEMICLHNVRDVTRPVRDDTGALRYFVHALSGSSGVVPRSEVQSERRLSKSGTRLGG